MTWSPEIKIVSEINPAWVDDVYADGDVFYVTWREQHPPDWIWRICFKRGGWYYPGDVDHSGEVDIADLTYLVNYMFKKGWPPVIEAAAQMDGQGGVDVSDLTYLVKYMFKQGPPPVGEL